MNTPGPNEIPQLIPENCIIQSIYTYSKGIPIYFYPLFQILLDKSVLIFMIVLYCAYCMITFYLLASLEDELSNRQLQQFLKLLRFLNLLILTLNRMYTLKNEISCQV